MTIATFIDQFERQYDVALVAHENRLHVLGLETLPTYARVVLASARPQVLAALLHQEQRDTPLSVSRGQDELIGLGFCQLDTGTWCHPHGDAVGDQILAGLLDPAEAEAEHEQHVEDLRRGGWLRELPPRVEVEVTEIHPGYYRWTERAGERTVPTYQGRPLKQE